MFIVKIVLFVLLLIFFLHAFVNLATQAKVSAVTLMFLVVETTIIKFK